MEPSWKVETTVEEALAAFEGWHPAVREMLGAANRSPMRPAHEHFMISAPGHETLITHVFDREDKYLESDAVSGVKESLITTFERHGAGEAPDGRMMDEAFYAIEYDFVLNPKGG